MSRPVTVSEFALDALVGPKRNGNGQTSVRVARAIRFYLSDRDSGRPGWRYPGFLREREAGAGVELELSIEASLWSSIESEAEAQGVSVSQLVEHAALYFAAEMDAGRATERIVGDLEAEPRKGTT